MVVKELSPEACQGHKAHETWGAGLYEGDTELGRIFLSRSFGEVFAHGWECKGDTHGAAMLFFAARRKVKQWGAKKMYIHFSPTDKETAGFWLKQGFRPVCLVFEGDI